MHACRRRKNRNSFPPNENFHCVSMRIRDMTRGIDEIDQHFHGITKKFADIQRLRTWSNPPFLRIVILFLNDISSVPLSAAYINCFLFCSRRYFWTLSMEALCPLDHSTKCRISRWGMIKDQVFFLFLFYKWFHYSDSIFFCTRELWILVDQVNNLSLIR